MSRKAIRRRLRARRLITAMESDLVERLLVLRRAKARARVDAMVGIGATMLTVRPGSNLKR